MGRRKVGLTVDQAVPQLMEAARIPSEVDRRKKFREILNQVHSNGYHEGSEDCWEGMQEV